MIFSFWLARSEGLGCRPRFLHGRALAASFITCISLPLSESRCGYTRIGPLRTLRVFNCIAEMLKTTPIYYISLTNMTSIGLKFRMTSSARMISLLGRASDSTGSKVVTASFVCGMQLAIQAKASCW